MIVLIGAITTANPREQAWCLLAAQGTVHSDGSAEFLFRRENRIAKNKRASLFASSRACRARGGFSLSGKGEKAILDMRGTGLTI